MLRAVLIQSIVCIMRPSASVLFVRRRSTFLACLTRLPKGGGQPRTHRPSSRVHRPVSTRLCFAPLTRTEHLPADSLTNVSTSRLPARRLEGEPLLSEAIMGVPIKVMHLCRFLDLCSLFCLKTRQAATVCIPQALQALELLAVHLPRLCRGRVVASQGVMQMATVGTQPSSEPWGCSPCLPDRALPIDVQTPRAGWMAVAAACLFLENEVFLEAFASFWIRLRGSVTRDFEDESLEA